MDRSSPILVQTEQIQLPQCTEPVGHPSVYETQQIQGGPLTPTEHTTQQKH